MLYVPSGLVPPAWSITLLARAQNDYACDRSLGWYFTNQDP
jgi:hypothetical protein